MSTAASWLLMWIVLSFGTVILYVAIKYAVMFTSRTRTVRRVNDRTAWIYGDAMSWNGDGDERGAR